MKYNHLLEALNSFCESTATFSKDLYQGEPENSEIDHVRFLLPHIQTILSGEAWRQTSLRDQAGNDLLALIRTNPKSFLTLYPSFRLIQSALVNVLSTTNATKSTLIVELSRHHPEQVKVALTLIPQGNRYRLLTPNTLEESPLLVFARDNSELKNLRAVFETLTLAERQAALELQFANGATLIRAAADQVLSQGARTSIFYDNYTYLLMSCGESQAQKLLTQEQPNHQPPLLSTIATQRTGVIALLRPTLNALSQEERYSALLAITYKGSPFVNSLDAKGHPNENFTPSLLRMICQVLTSQQLSLYCNHLANETETRIFADFMRFYSRLCVKYTLTQCLFGRATLCSKDEAIRNTLTSGGSLVNMMASIKSTGTYLTEYYEVDGFSAILELGIDETINDISQGWQSQ